MKLPENRSLKSIAKFRFHWFKNGLSDTEKCLMTSEITNVKPAQRTWRSYEKNMNDTDRSHISATCVIYHSDLFQKRYHKNRTLSNFKFVRQRVEE